jgi:adenylate kinase family enzyme
MTGRDELLNCRRILVIGCCGSGKSTFGRILGSRLNRKVIHLDRHFWKPGWIMREPDEFENTVRELISGDEWIIEGNYSGTLSLRAMRADFIFFYDYSSFFCVYRILKRSFKTRLGLERRQDITEGCNEKWFDKEFLDFIKFTWNFKKVTTPRNYRTLEEINFDKEKLLVFKKRSEEKEFIRKLLQWTK